MENVSDPLEYCPDVVISKLRAEIALKDQQIEFLRKKLNDVLNAANITGEKDVKTKTSIPAFLLAFFHKF